ncbi:MAG: ATP-grasp domain-containing protein [Lachnospiraceae bacterium]|nr:ATP-grasp domain-containing protein [Lachnospiraceae bacterium]
MIKVWFNHWFSTSYRLIELMKEDAREQIYVIGSNRQRDSVIQKVCDEWYEEPDIDGEEYLAFCLEFCREHKVDAFVPRRKMVEISQNRERFSQLGVRVMADAYDTIALLNDKAAAYTFFKDCGGLHIPDFFVVNQYDAFEQAYRRLRADYGQVCVKFVSDEGGMSFRKIVDQVDPLRQLRTYPGSSIAFETLAETLRAAKTFDDMMVMPYLPGKEISVDCLQTGKGLIAIPRTKGAARHEYVAYNAEILRMAEHIAERTGLQCPCNIQFRFMDDVPFLLEVNTRMSGGLQMSCLAAQVNIPNIALNKLFGREIDWTMDRAEKTVSYIELPQIITVPF